MQWPKVHHGLAKLEQILQQHDVASKQGMCVHQKQRSIAAHSMQLGCSGQNLLIVP